MNSRIGGALVEVLRREPALADVVTRRNWDAHQEIGREGERCSHLFVLAQGQVLLTRQPGGGKERTLAILGPGDIFGEDALHPPQRWQQTSRSLTSAWAYELPGAALPLLAGRYPALNTALIECLLDRLDLAYRRLELLDHQSATDKVGALLELLAGKSRGLDERYAPVPPLTQAQLADMLGMARETVARAMAELQRKGTVRRRGRVTWVRQEAILL